MNFEEKLDKEIESEKEKPGRSGVWGLFENKVSVTKYSPRL